LERGFPPHVRYGPEREMDPRTDMDPATFRRRLRDVRRFPEGFYEIFRGSRR